MPILRISLQKLWGAGRGAGPLRDEHPTGLSQLWQPTCGKAPLHSLRDEGGEASGGIDLLRAG